jgi:hypothetical protein
MKKIPYWLKGGLFLSIVGTLIFSILPDEFSNMIYAPWYLGWLIHIAFIIFAPICMMLDIDFVSDAASSSDLFWDRAVWLFSIFIVLFIVGTIGSILVMQIRRRMQPTA